MRVDETKFTSPSQGAKCPACGTVNRLPANVAQPIQQPIAPPKHEEPIPAIVGWLVVHDENTRPQTYLLKYGKNIVGRKSDAKPCDVMIESEDGYMSRNHCVVEVQRNRAGVYEYVLSEVGSTNGTFINADAEKRMKPGDEIYLADGDTVQIGRTKVVLKTLRTAKDAADAGKIVRNNPVSHTVVM